MQIFIPCKTTLHVSGVTAPIIRSIENSTRSLRYRSYYLYRYSPPTWRGVAIQVVWPVPVAVGTVFNTPDAACCDTRNIYSSFAVNKYLHIVASVGFLFTKECFFLVAFFPHNSTEFCPQFDKCLLSSSSYILYVVTKHILLPYFT